MSEHAANSPQAQSAHGDGAPSRERSEPRSDTHRSTSDVRSRAETLRQLLDDATSGKISDTRLVEQLQSLDATPEEASDILDELTQRRHQQSNLPQGGGQGPEGEPPPGEPDDSWPDEFRKKLGWQLVRAKLEALRSDRATEQDPLDLLALLRGDAASGAIPKSALDVAPHLADLPSASGVDKHITKTFEMRETLSQGAVSVWRMHPLVLHNTGGCIRQMQMHPLLPALMQREAPYGDWLDGLKFGIAKGTHNGGFRAATPC